jgi:hypothetical protein
MTLSKTSLAAPNCVKGWILDVYPSDPGKMAVWVITGKRAKVSIKNFIVVTLY